jgi:hypothetical protein
VLRVDNDESRRCRRARDIDLKTEKRLDELSLRRIDFGKEELSPVSAVLVPSVGVGCSVGCESVIADAPCELGALPEDDFFDGREKALEREESSIGGCCSRTVVEAIVGLRGADKDKKLDA